MRRIAVYGSLRAGFGNNPILEDSELLSKEVVNIPYEMISLGGFPGLVPSKNNHDITIEIYEVLPSIYNRVERLEGYPHFYQKGNIETSKGEAEIYILEKEHYRASEIIESGDWAEHRSKLITTYF